MSMPVHAIRTIEYHVLWQGRECEKETTDRLTKRATVSGRERARCVCGREGGGGGSRKGDEGGGEGCRERGWDTEDRRQKTGKQTDSMVQWNGLAKITLTEQNRQTVWCSGMDLPKSHWQNKTDRQYGAVEWTCQNHTDRTKQTDSMVQWNGLAKITLTEQNRQTVWCSGMYLPKSREKIQKTLTEQNR